MRSHNVNIINKLREEFDSKECEFKTKFDEILKTFNTYALLDILNAYKKILDEVKVNFYYYDFCEFIINAPDQYLLKFRRCNKVGLNKNREKCKKMMELLEEYKKTEEV